MGSLMLGCGSGAMLMVRLSNRRLRGLGWLGAAFVCGGLGAGLLAHAAQLPSFLPSLGSDLLVLLAAVLLQVAVLEMMQAPSLVPRLGLGLMLTYAIAGVALNGVGEMRGRQVKDILLGLVLALQLAQTARVLISGKARETRVPAWFTATLLLSLIGIDVFRSGVLLLRRGSIDTAAVEGLQTFTIMVYMAAALGLAFGFFWMTTTELSLELEQMANTDPLTRLFNRRIFQEWCEREVARSRRNGTPVSLLMMDLDHFKQINDQFGHQGGDEMLCAAVERMQDSVRGIDVLGRWGGEEFVALLPGASPEAAMLVAERVRANVEKLRLPSPASGAGGAHGRTRMTVSVGVTTYQSSEDDLPAMLRRADEALYRAKATGRNRAVFADGRELERASDRAARSKEIELGGGRGILV